MSNDNNKNNLDLFEDEKSILLDHDYDGIQELNHPLPSWWSWIWGISIVFSIPYLVYYHVQDAPGIRETYSKDVGTMLEERAAKLAAAGGFNLEEYQGHVAANDGINKGKVIFEENCASCHLEDGGGDIGPNLTDKYWLHGNSVADQYKTVTKGVEDNGMPAWEELLEKNEIYEVISFVRSLQGTTPAEAKEPQGELYE